MLILVRHGRTAANAQKRMQGTVDNPLDEVGRQQAERIAKALEAPARVISSPALRARDTASAIGTPEVDERWLELNFGVYDSLPLSDVPAEVWSNWRTQPDWAPEGGESMAGLRARVMPACVELAEQAAEEDVVVVSHVSPIKAAVTWALGTDPAVAWRTHLDVASISRVLFRGASPILTSFNETGHLD